MRNAFGKITATLTIVERLFDPENERVTWGNVVTRMMDYKRDCPEYRITLHSKDRLRSITVSYERCRLRIEKRRPIFGPKFTVALKYFPIFTDFSPKENFVSSEKEGGTMLELETFWIDNDPTFDGKIPPKPR